MSIHEDQKMPDITGNRFQRPASHTFSHAGYGKYIESDKAECLKASGGDIGGWREPDRSEAECLAAIEGNGSRPSHKGTGINDGRIMYTLNSVEVHGVVVKNDYCGTWKTVGALCQTDYKWVQNQQVAQGKILPIAVRERRK